MADLARGRSYRHGGDAIPAPTFTPVPQGNLSGERPLSARTSPAAWEWFRHVIFYRTGFPFEWLASLRWTRSLDSCEQLVAHRTRHEALRRRLLTKSFPAAVADTDRRAAVKALSRLRRRLGQRRPLPEELIARVAPEARPNFLNSLREWNESHGELERLDLHAREVFTSELRARREALWQLAEDDGLRTAIFTSNPNISPEFIDKMRRVRQRGRRRRFERRLYTYLQRATSKTDVATLFGPIDYAQLDPSWDGWASVECDPELCVRDREVFFSYWMVEALAESASHSSEVRLHLRPRRSPMCAITGERAFLHMPDETVVLEDLQRRLLTKCDGTRTVTELAASLGVPPAQLLKEIELLAERRLLSLRFDIPSSIFHPFDRFREQIEELPDDLQVARAWQSAVARFEASRIAYRDGGLERRVAELASLESLFENVTGLPARRSPGEFYADRTLLYEECRGTMRQLRLGTRTIDRLRDELSPALDLCAAYGGLWLRHARALALYAYRDLAPRRGSISFTLLAERLRHLGERGELPAKSQEIVTFEAAWSDLVQRRWEGRRKPVHLSAGDVAPLIAECARDDSLHASVDVLIAASSAEDLERGSYRLVLGEVGENVYVWGSQFLFYEESTAAEREIEELFQSLPGYHPWAVVLPQRRHKGLLSEAFSGTFVEAVGRSERSTAGCLPLHALRVAECNGDLSLLGPDGERYQFFHHHDDLVHMWAFAPSRMALPPLGWKGLSPRIEISGAVVRRATWNVARDEILPSRRTRGFDLFEHVTARRLAHQLPSRLFVHLPDEIKAVAIDLDSYFGIDLLDHLSRDISRLHLVEMLPEEDEMWLHDRRGRYCTELRFLAFRRGVAEVR